MSLKMIFFSCSLILIVCILEVKSVDNCFSDGRSHLLDGYGQFLQDFNFRNQIIVGQGQPPPTELVQRERAYMEQIRNQISELKQFIQVAEQEFAQVQSIQQQLRKDQCEQLRLEDQIDAFIRSVQSVPATQITPAQGAQNRRTLTQHLLALKHHLERRLAGFTLLKRATELQKLGHYQNILDEFRKNEVIERRQEPAPANENLKNQRISEYHKLDHLEYDARIEIQLIRERHSQNKPINVEHALHISKLNILLTNLKQQAEIVKKRREQERLVVARPVQQPIMNRPGSSNQYPLNQYPANQASGSHIGIPSGVPSTNTKLFGSNTGNQVNRGPNRNG